MATTTTTISNGVTDLGCSIFVHEGVYVDRDGSRKNYVDPDWILVGASTADNRMAYAACEQLDKQGMEFIPERRVPMVFDDLEQEKRCFRLQCRPIAIPGDLNTWSVAQVTNLS
jgi:hypothetical protein